jgi:hypothetical protein
MRYSIEDIEGVDFNDHPDYSDAHASVVYDNQEKRYLTEEELDDFNYNHGDLVNQAACEGACVNAYERMKIWG